jgi:hypothetical protein
LIVKGHLSGGSTLANVKRYVFPTGVNHIVVCDICNFGRQHASQHFTNNKFHFMFVWYACAPFLKIRRAQIALIIFLVVKHVFPIVKTSPQNIGRFRSLRRLFPTMIGKPIPNAMRQLEGSVCNDPMTT